MPTKNKKGQKRSARPTVAQKRPRACFMQVQDGGSAASNNNTWSLLFLFFFFLLFQGITGHTFGFVQCNKHYFQSQVVFLFFSLVWTGREKALGEKRSKVDANFAMVTASRRSSLFPLLLFWSVGLLVQDHEKRVPPETKPCPTIQGGTAP